ncbi:MAG: 50S ribosomal protein L23 [Candidatus Marsarchaeota archaeon]|nr:50S ribosomal protein L23 [Candidatus Marsarchaeota archaeon]
MAILKYPLATEKAVKLVESENVVTYIADSRATKTQIKKEFEKVFNVKVRSIRTANMPTNLKKAFIKLAPGFKATDVSEKLKIA